MLTYLDTLIGFAIVMLMISLLITLLTQIVSAFLNHRGSNLRWGLKTLFANIDPKAYPQITSHANLLANQVLRHCLISDSWFSGNVVAQWVGARIPPLKKLFDRFQLASAIRPEELAGILQHIATNPPAALSQLPAADLEALRQDIQALLSAGSGSSLRNLSLVSGAISAAVPAIPDPTALMQETVSNIHTAAGDLEAWFNSIMDRVTQKFVVYMRIWTALFGCCFAFGTGLNSISLLNEMYTNSTYRNNFTNVSQQLTSLTTTILDPQNNLSAALTTALHQALTEAKVAPAAPPPAIPTRVEGEQWIRSNVPPGQMTAVLTHFRADSEAASQKLLNDSSQKAADVVDVASRSGFEILKIRWPAKPNVGYIFGVIGTAALLGMGAPFWFNALKTLTNLRPIVASKEEAERGD